MKILALLSEGCVMSAGFSAQSNILAELMRRLGCTLGIGILPLPTFGARLKLSQASSAASGAVSGGRRDAKWFL